MVMRLMLFYSMVSILILLLGMFWESSMDIIGDERNFDRSIWKLVADYFDKKNIRVLGNQFWDNKISWANKWKNKDPEQGEVFLGSSTIFVSIMDGWHLVKFIWLIHVFAAIVFYTEITDYFLIDILILYSIFGVGHELFRRILIIKRQAVVN